MSRAPANLCELPFLFPPSHDVSSKRLRAPLTWMVLVVMAAGFASSELMMKGAIAAADERPNFVLIIADDISYNDLGCCGSPNGGTPRLDQLAAESLRLTNAFLTTSSCSPSRASIITGRYPHNNGAAAELHQKISWHLPSVTGVLRAAGYYTALSGKNHMTWQPTPAGQQAPPQPFDQIDNGRRSKQELGPHEIANSGGHANWIRAIRQAPQGQPFMLWLASLDAHRDWDGCEQWDPELYGPKHVPESLTLPPAFIDTPQTRIDFACYLNEVTRFDHFVGRVVDELKQRDLWENTCLFVLADNGRPFPRAKTRMIDAGMQTYLFLTGPALASPGASSESLVSVIDIAPTILDFAGVPKPETFQGRSLRPLYQNKNAKIRPLAFSEHNWHDYEALGRSVRNQRWLYIENDRPQFASQGPADSVRSATHQDLRAALESGADLSLAQSDVLRAPRPARELYDRRYDPDQTTNLIDDPEHASMEASLTRAMAFWRDQTGDSAPKSLTPDRFDRQTGDRLKLTREQVDSTQQPPPGSDRNADQINAEGLAP